jgi:hypothetical protein
LGFFGPEEVKFLDEHSFLFVILLELNPLLFQPFQDGLDPGQQLLAPLDLGVELSIEQIAVVHNVGDFVHGQFVNYVVGILSGHDQLVVTHFSGTECHAG